MGVQAGSGEAGDVVKVTALNVELMQYASTTFSDAPVASSCCGKLCRARGLPSNA